MAPQDVTCPRTMDHDHDTWTKRPKGQKAAKRRGQREKLDTAAKKTKQDGPSKLTLGESIRSSLVLVAGTKLLYDSR